LSLYTKEKITLQQNLQHLFIYDDKI